MMFYDGDQHAVSVNSLASTLEGFNQCVRVLAGRGLDQVITMYMTAYMTKTGFTETTVDELYLAALQRAAMYNTGATKLDFLRKQLNKPSPVLYRSIATFPCPRRSPVCSILIAIPISPATVPSYFRYTGL